MMSPQLLKMIEKIERASKTHGLFFSTKEEGSTVIIQVYTDSKKKDELIGLIIEDGKTICGHIEKQSIERLRTTDLGVITGLAVATIEVAANGTPMDQTVFGLTKLK